ncbi:acyl-CoA dehydrogenase family protein [Zavarzinia marina]|uniref:acyl-CoA dehydrogenase family protein n=1 Tax=Zavarzinia marina TaxID=2911065 RepID=UPI0038B677FF
MASSPSRPALDLAWPLLIRCFNISRNAPGQAVATRIPPLRRQKGTAPFRQGADARRPGKSAGLRVRGGIGYSRHKPFAHIYRHHRRHRIIEGAAEIRMRKVAAYSFG